MKISSWRYSWAKANPSLLSGHSELGKKKINESNCYVIQEFLNGNLFTRWNNKCWGTLPTDLTIQQVLMESLKSIGGLYSWKRNGWSTLPYYTKITTKIEKLSNSKQHNKGYQMTWSTMIWDPKDTATILEYLQSHNSFSHSEFLIDASNCIASSISNAQLAEEVGKSIIASIEG